ncbi:hypothetical protein PC9H_004377 [Pleurotus ostreatus]|uniref:Glucose-methanol-choline oxidoreductase C-terminal domain-containing protein n=1 Tax=Pleurotus ostreatus TaxID=5322 RepID=A0A8H7A7K6_PLEOS|nr:uncharacterized protein PC9H_004377 [Pleurotus ostreatus]KAF7437535.1 hypothetical protein PC9H_004377 [Pleurotus ostreatus]KAJ8703484.1 hypothetical protein PTI98_002106 [Pleurotus ostreatus]
MEEFLKFPPRLAPHPVAPSYTQRDRPLSYQPCLHEVNTAPFNNYGYPEPGIQAPTAKQVIAKDFLMSDETWEDLCRRGDVDFIVIGSGFTALAFIEQTLKQDPFKRIVCLERGDFWLPDHFQNLPLPFKYTLGGPSETFPFMLLRDTFQSDVKFVHGSTPFFGGRSTFWSAWSLRPTPELMRNWPDSMVNTSKEPAFWDRCNKLLRVTGADEIGEPYGTLQSQINDHMERGLDKMRTADEAYPAPLAVSSMAKTSTIRFTKFSTPGPLLSLYKKQQQLAKEGKGAPLLFATDTSVEYLMTSVGFPPPPPAGDDVSVVAIRSSRSTDLPVKQETQVILCAGAFPSTTLILNSFPDNVELQRTAGRTMTGHFLSHIVARVPRSLFRHLNPDSLEIAAEYVAGRHPDNHLQYHIQITAISSPDPNQDAEDAARFCPDYAAAASKEQLRGSEDYVIFVCATLGELSEDNESSFFRLNKLNTNKDPTANCVLQVLLTQKDRDLWDVMDNATFKAIEVLAGERHTDDIEWWHEPKGAGSGEWKAYRPGNDTIRMDGIVHEASLLPLGDGEDACVDNNYKLKGVNNVYLTGGALFPTAGSWNPTLTMCGFAQDLAIKLTPKENRAR